MKKSSNFKNQLKKYGLNPQDWCTQARGECYMVFENIREKGIRMMALINKGSICELQLIDI